MHYRLQLNAYKYLIEKYYDKRVSAMYIVGMHPDNGSEPFVDEVPYMPSEINALMEEQRRRVKEMEAMSRHDFIARDPLGGMMGFAFSDSQIPPSNFDIEDGQQGFDYPEDETYAEDEVEAVEGEPVDPPDTRMPSDGLCMYHAYNAAQNIQKWLSLTATQQVTMAYITKKRMLELINNQEDIARLSGSGAESYPSTDDFKYFSKLLLVDRGIERTVIYGVQDNAELDAVYPPGVEASEVAFHVRQCKSYDGAGHPSDHYNLIKTFLDPLDDLFTQLETKASSSTSVVEPKYPEGAAVDSPQADSPVTSKSSNDKVTDGLPNTGLEMRKKWRVAKIDNVLFEQEENEVFESMSKLMTSAQRIAPPREGVISDAMQLQKRIRAKHPHWTDELCRLTVAAVVVSGLRSTDISAPETVGLVWLCLGDVRLRAAKGYLRYFDLEQGVWRPYSGLLPEGIFSYMRLFLNTLEGMFRSFTGKVKRDENGVVSEVSELLKKAPISKRSLSAKSEWCAIEWRKAALWNKKGNGKGKSEVGSSASVVSGKGKAKGVQGAISLGELDSLPGQESNQIASVVAAPKEDEKLEWYFGTAYFVQQLTPRLVQSLVRGADVVKHYIEWCETPEERTPGFVYLDRAVRYDIAGTPTVVVPQPQQNDNFYFGCPSYLFALQEAGKSVPRPIDDPVVVGVQKEVLTALRQTFWGNMGGLKACRAALALAKRGLNVTQCFIFLARGGCGLSLFTTLLATSLGDELHKYFDPYLFYDDEELRKTVELLVGGIVFSGQERPQGGSHKKMQIHLWKKFNSGEGLRGRLPYAILTRMVRLLGWVRLEVNSALEFYDVAEVEYESILRRGCVIEVYARFFDSAYLKEHLPDHEQYGIFARKPHLEEAFTTLPYAAGWNRSQHAFEEKNGRQQCLDIIINFCRNRGDRGRTDSFLRECCRLKKRDEAFQNFSVSKGVICGTEVQCDMDDLDANQTNGDEALQKFSVMLMRECCEQRFI